MTISNLEWRVINLKLAENSHVRSIPIARYRGYHTKYLLYTAYYELSPVKPPLIHVLRRLGSIFVLSFGRRKVKTPKFGRVGGMAVSIWDRLDLRRNTTRRDTTRHEATRRWAPGWPSHRRATWLIRRPAQRRLLWNMLGRPSTRIIHSAQRKHTFERLLTPRTELAIELCCQNTSPPITNRILDIHKRLYRGAGGDFFLRLWDYD